ncbi:MAG TPA: TolC family protein [Alcanivoracaceae bacterium]|nr:TolC family protein [Alcanivoracaceae bacterium]
MQNMTRSVKRTVLGVVLTATLQALPMAALAQPLDLLTTWELARQHAPEFRAEQAAAQAGLSQSKQARSLWLPTVGASATAGRGTHNATTEGAYFSMPGQTSEEVIFKTSVRNGEMYHYEVGIKQPLLDRKRLVQSRQLRLASEVADYQWQQAQQELLLTSVQRYFDVLVSRETVAVLTQQLDQVRRVQEETTKRYEIGDLPITSTHESTAQLRHLEAQLAEAEMQAVLAEEAYANFTGQAPNKTLSIDLTTPLVEPELHTLNEWVEDVRRHNPVLKMQDKGVQIAKEQIESYRAWKSPTVDLVGRAAYEKLDGSGRYGDAINKADEWMVGVQLNVPIFTGGYRSHKRVEATHQHEQRLAENDSLRQEITQQTRSAWLAVKTSSKQVNALQQALRANEARLAATQLGHEVGHNTTLENLDAEHALASTQLQLLQAKVAFIMYQLQLNALAGGLNIEELALANTYLQQP